jgi:hypothetical protein
VRPYQAYGERIQPLYLTTERPPSPASVDDAGDGWFLHGGRAGVAWALGTVSGFPVRRPPAGRVGPGAAQPALQRAQDRAAVRNLGVHYPGSVLDGRNAHRPPRSPLAQTGGAPVRGPEHGTHSCGGGQLPAPLAHYPDQRGAPKALTYIVLATLQIAPRFQAKANTILDAQRARGLETEGGLGRRIRALLPLVVPLVLGSIIDIEERAMSLEARAFSREGKKTSLLILPDSVIQKVARIALLFATAAAIAAGVWLRLAR